MKLTIVQALGTVLNIQIAPKVDGTEWFVIRRNIDVMLGQVGVMTFDQAVWKAIELTDFKTECHFAIFPMGSNREDIYMAVEREMLRQEASTEFAGKKMWELMGDDPRELITAIMTQLRDCAMSVVSPLQFQINMLRVCVLCIASMQWVSDWLVRLRLRQATLAATHPEPPKIVAMQPAPAAATPAVPVAPLFGVAGLQVVEPERKGSQLIDKVQHTEPKGWPAYCKHHVPAGEKCEACDLEVLENDELRRESEPSVLSEKLDAEARMNEADRNETPF